MESLEINEVNIERAIASLVNKLRKEGLKEEAYALDAFSQIISLKLNVDSFNNETRSKDVLKVLNQSELLLKYSYEQIDDMLEGETQKIQYNDETKVFIKQLNIEMESDLNTLRSISKEYNNVLINSENNENYTNLKNLFDKEKYELETSYKLQKYSLSNDIKKELYISFKQYVDSSLNEIETAYKAPSFLEFMLTETPTLNHVLV